MTTAEPSVTLTDFALALECLAFAVIIATRPALDNLLKAWVIVFFGSLALAPMLGGMVHGFVTDEQSLAHAVLWNAALIAIGATALRRG